MGYRRGEVPIQLLKLHSAILPPLQGHQIPTYRDNHMSYELNIFIYEILRNDGYKINEAYKAWGIHLETVTVGPLNPVFLSPLSAKGSSFPCSPLSAS